MITRLEIDGFKSFADFAVDIPPFVAIVGPNASGKSNIFDAMSFMGRVVTLPLDAALSAGRGERSEQFRLRGDGERVRSMRFAVELLVERVTEDNFGTSATLPHTRLRYEIVIELRKDERDIERPYVTEERILPIRKSEDRAMARVSSAFADEHLRYEANQWKILTTDTLDDGRRVFRAKPSRENAKQGRNVDLLPADRAVASALSSITAANQFPLLYAVRREIAGWRFLQLEPTSLRSPSSGSPGEHLDVTGSNLAWILETIRHAEIVDDHPGLDPLAADLARVIAGFRSVHVSQNKALGQWEVELESRDEGLFSARVASDGTLRLLALLTALYEPDQPGVLCLEEPENGINPRRLSAMIDVLRDLVTDPWSEDGIESSDLVQLVVSSHSPLLPLRMAPAELLVVDTVSLVEGPAGSSRITRARRILHEGEQLAISDDGGWSPLPTRERERLSGVTPEDAERLVDAR